MKMNPPLLRTLSLIAVFSVGAHAQTITSAVPGYISYQGRALNSAGTVVGAGTPVNRTVTFRVWDHSSNTLPASLLYSEQQVVTISEGEFSVLIGQGTATAGTNFGFSETDKGQPTVKIGDLGVFAGANRYLGVTIDDGTAAVDNEISPRQQIVASAYAFRAKYAEQLGANGSAALTALDSGNIGIGNTNPPARFTITAAGIGTSTPQMLLTADDTTERLRLGVDSTGNGTGFLQAFKEGMGAQNLLLNPEGGNVGIGTSNPTAKLDVSGEIKATSVTASGAVQAASVTTTGDVTVGGTLLATVPYVRVVETAPWGQGAGTAVAGTLNWRKFNAETDDASNLATFSSGDIVLQPGTYRVSISAPAYKVGQHQARLRTYGGTHLLSGTMEGSEPAEFNQTRSLISGTITLATTTTLLVQHYCLQGMANYGKGTWSDPGGGAASPWPAADNVLQVYSVAEFWKIK